MSSITRGISVGTIAVDTLSEALWPRLAALLDVTERNRAACFTVERDRRRQIAVHALKRLMLTACSPDIVSPKSWQFRSEAGGKEYVLDRRGPFFYATHCDGLVACGVSRRYDLGLDLKPLIEDASFAFAKNQLDAIEEAWLGEQPFEIRLKTFARLWNLKEAFRNADAAGLSKTPNFLAWIDPHRSHPAGPASSEAASWNFHQVDIMGALTLALAWPVGSRKIPVDVRTVHIEDLLYGVSHTGRSSPWRFGSRFHPVRPAGGAHNRDERPEASSFRHTDRENPGKN